MSLQMSKTVLSRPQARQPCRRYALTSVKAASPRSSEVGAVSSEELFQRAETFMNTGGYFAPMTDDTANNLLSEEMVFRGSVFGPLNKRDYIDTIKLLKPWQGFPDLQHNSFGFCADPVAPVCIWFFVRPTGTFTQEWTPFDKTPLRPNGKAVASPVEAWNMIFTPDGKIKYLAVGYCADRIMSDSPQGSTTTALVALFRTATGVEAPLRGDPVSLGLIRVVEALTGRRTTPTAEIPAWFKQACRNGELFGPEGL